MSLTDKLLLNIDEKYREFSKKLIPDTNYQIIGVRTPIIKKLAKDSLASNDYKGFLLEKHTFYEEYLLHGILLGIINCETNKKLLLIEEFLPYIDNWAICDCTVAGLKFFKKNPETTLKFAKKWIKSNNPYTIRFGIVTLMSYLLTDVFCEETIEICSKIKSSHYYVNMGLAWFFSVALVKNYETALPYFTNKRLNKFVHNKSIQKAIESFRISNDKKKFLKKIKI